MSDYKTGNGESRGIHATVVYRVKSILSILLIPPGLSNFIQAFVEVFQLRPAAVCEMIGNFTRFQCQFANTVGLDRTAVEVS